jgi:hypothetical protein
MRPTSCGLNTSRQLARLVHERHLLGEIGSIERHIEEEPQRRNRTVDLGCMRAARCQMQLIASHVFLAGAGRRSAKKRREVLDPLHVVVLGLRPELADRHVFDHAPAQRAHSLVGHGGAPVLSEVVDETSISRQGASARYGFDNYVGSARGSYRASGLVL